jgi:hypothetical protein
MDTKTDTSMAASVLPMTPVRRQQLRVDLKQAAEEVVFALRRGGSPQRYSELRMLMMALDAAEQVLSSSQASRD